MGKDTIFIMIFSVFSLILWGQPLEKYDFDILVNGELLSKGLAGGMNLPQFSEVDLDHDGIKDLFVFDKSGDAISVFKNAGIMGSVDYSYAPELLEHFPRLINWAMMLDYNNDGAGDIFAFSSQPGIAGVEVHKGHWEGDRLAFDKLSFGQVYDILYYEGNGGTPVNLYVSNIDIPAIKDVDGDGDVDILTFASNGGYVLFFRNFSAEMGLATDTLIFKKVDECWGKFYESGLSTVITLGDNPNTCANMAWGGSEVTSRHAGSTVMAMDVDQDGDQELFLGDVSYDNIVLLHNGGTAQNAFMTDQDTLFPNISPVDIPIFPGAFAVDLDNDGDQDIISAPSSTELSITQNNAWRYENLGASANPQFQFKQNDFLCGEMLDLGTGAFPAMADVDGDGLLDLVVGNETYYQESGALDCRLFLFKNVGTKSEPKFELSDDNYLNLQPESVNHWSFTPSFGDLDGDGDLDLMVGEYLGSMYYFENLAGANQPFEFAAPVFPYHNIDVGLAAAPFMVDADEDGLMDLIVGEQNGNINFIKNVGSIGAPNFGSNHEAAPNIPFWGGVDTRVLGFPSGSSIPRMWKESGLFRLFCGSEKGRIFEYTDIESNLDGVFTKVTDDYGRVLDGGNIYPVFQDINNDGFRELIIGNRRGGLTAFKTELPQPVGLFTPSLTAKKLVIEPNLVKDKFKVKFGVGKAGEMTIYDIQGRITLRQKVRSGDIIWVNKLPKGNYWVVIQSTDHYTGSFVR